MPRRPDFFGTPRNDILLIGLIVALLVFALGVVNEAQAAAPNFQAAGTAVQKAARTVSPAWPAHVIGDIALLFVESQGEDAITLSVPAGFVEVLNSPQNVNTGNNGTRLTIFWARATSTSMSSPTIAATSDHVIAQILTYRGVVSTGDPWDVTAGNTEDVSDTSLSATGVTTSVADTLIVVAAAQGRDANSTTTFSSWTNANLTNINERTDYAKNNGNGGGFGVMDGVKATVGATGNTTATLSNAFRKAFLTIALKPPGNPSSLAFGVQPSNTQAGATISPAITVKILDATGALVSWDSTTQVTIAIGTNPGGGTLNGTMTVTAVNGIATFSDLSINRSGTGYTLTASATGLTGATSSAFNIITGSATKLGFVQQPSNTQACATVTPAVTVAIQDSAGNTVTSATNAVTIAIGTNPGSGTLSGTLTVNAVAGVATFSNLSINKSGTGYTLTASAGGLTGATSSTFNITAGPANKLVFLQQPGNTIFNQTITPAVTCEIQDSACGARVDSSASVTIAIGANPGGGTLNGTTTVSASSGLATFNNLSIGNTESVAANGYTLICSSSGLTSATSSAFNITTGAYGTTQCAGQRYGSDLGCTANDIALTTMSISSGTPTSYCIGGETIVVDLDVTVTFQNPARYDVGIFISNDSKDPQLYVSPPAAENSCKVAILPLTAPFQNLDSNGGQDTCGDGSNSISGTLTIPGVTILCKAATGSSNKLFVPFVVSWDQNSTPPGAVCTSIANPVPGALSKCNKADIALSQGVVNVVVLPKVTKTRDQTTPAPGQCFTFTVTITNNTGVALSGATFQDTPSYANLILDSCPPYSLACTPAGGAACPAISAAAIQAGVLLPDMPVNAAQAITGITKANPAVVTYSGADTYANDDKIIISDVIGMTEVNDNEFTVANVNTGANTFELSGINSANYTAYTSGGLITELSSLKFTIPASDSNPTGTFSNTAKVTVSGQPLLPASFTDTFGGGRVRVIKWREVLGRDK